MDLVSGPGRAIGRDIAAGEAVEHEIDAFISRRHEQRLKSEPEREAEAVWVAAEKRQEALRRCENAAGWYGWHMLPRGALRAPVAGARGHRGGAVGNRRTEDGMSELPDSSWDRDYQKRTQECIDAKAQAAGRPSPLMLPASGVEVKALGIGREWFGKKAIPNVETKEEEG